MAHVKDTYYFSHDSNASRDPKMLEMRAVYGAEGYGWYWMIVEMMREQEDFKLKLCRRNAIAMHLQCKPDAAHSFVDACINDFDLFDSDGEYFWSNSLLRRMGKVKVKSEKARQAALSRWRKKGDANAMQTQCDRNASKVNESKVNESKVKDKRVPPLSSAQENRFAAFWSAYPKKRSKGQAEKAWAKIKPDEQLHDEILRSLERAKTSADWQKDGGQFIPHPATWLNAKGWEDDYAPAGRTTPKSWPVIKDWLEEDEHDEA